MIRKEAWPFYGTISGVRLCWELEKPSGPEGHRILKMIVSYGIWAFLGVSRGLRKVIVPVRQDRHGQDGKTRPAGNVVQGTDP